MLAFKAKDQSGKDLNLPSQESSFVPLEPGLGPRGRVSTKRTRQNRLFSMTQDFVNTYKRCNPAFRVIEALPQRVLTIPSEPVLNNGLDNEDSNLICKVHDTFQMKDYVFTVLDLLGTGTFGQVFRCMRSDTNEIVAVKVVKNKPAYHSQGLLEIKVARLLNSVHDPNDERHIVRLLDSFEYHGHVCLVFELLSVSLLDVLTQNQFRGLPLVVVQRFTRQILTALVALEEADVIHCDLKPENILLVPSSSTNPNSPNQPGGNSPPKRSHSNSSLADSSQLADSGENDDGSGGKRPPLGTAGRSSSGGLSDIKVIDFGSACFEGKTVYSYIQSRFYRSPEVLLGLPYNGAIDMWSLACVCAEMFLGLPLFPGVSQHNQLFRIVEMLGLPPDFLIEGKNGKKYFTTVDKNDGANKDAQVIENSPQSVCVGSAGTGTAASAGPAVPSGAKYRIKTAEEYASETNTTVPVLRKYLRYNRLDEVIMRCPLAQKARMTPEQKNVETVRRRCFLDFLQGLFRLNPFERWTARQALSHPFIQNTKFSGPFVPPPDMKINERKLNFMVLTQRKPPPSSFEAPNLTGVRAPSNFSSHAGIASGNSAQFTPLQLAHRRMSDPGIDHAFPQSKSGGPQLLKRGSPAHLKVEAQSSPTSESNPSTVESAVPFAAADAGVARSLSEEITAPQHFDVSHAVQPPPPPIGIAGHSDGAAIEESADALPPPGRFDHTAAQAIMRAKAREGQVSQLGPQLNAAPYQPQQAAQSFQGVAQQSQTQRYMQQQQQFAQQQRQRSMLPPQQAHKPMYEQSLYRHPAQAGSANFALQHPYGQQNDAYSAQQMNVMTPQGAMQMSGMAGMPGSSLGASYGNYSTVGSMQDGSSVIMTDFGLALMRPDMDEHRRLLSQTTMQAPYWQQQQQQPYGSPQNNTYSHPLMAMMGGEPQHQAVAMSYAYAPNMMQLAANSGFPYGHPAGQQPQQQQLAGSYDSKTMQARRRHQQTYDQSNQYQQQQNHMHNQPMMAGSPQQSFIAQQEHGEHGQNQNNVKRLSSRMNSMNSKQQDNEQRSRNEAVMRQQNHVDIRKPSPSYYKDERLPTQAAGPPSGIIKISAEATRKEASPGLNVVAGSYVGTPVRNSFHGLRAQKDPSGLNGGAANSFLEMEMVRRESFKATAQQAQSSSGHAHSAHSSATNSTCNSNANSNPNSRQNSTDSTGLSASAGVVHHRTAGDRDSAIATGQHQSTHSQHPARPGPANSSGDGSAGKKGKHSSGTGTEDVLEEWEPFFEVDDLGAK